MLDLPGVTLACLDTANHALALRAMERSRSGVRFARAVLLTDALPPGLAAPDGIEVIRVPRLASRDDYSRFVLKRLLPHVDTPHVLLVQWDGYVVNPGAWRDEFLDCDYLGARWFWFGDGHDVGNGGFSLRSRRLLEALQDPHIDLVEAEDLTIGRTFRPMLEREYGIRYGDAALAERFAFEAAYPVGRPFGFHGLFNFCHVVPPAELAELARGFGDAIARSPQLAQLLRNCYTLGAWEPAIAIAERMLAADPDRADVRGLLEQSRGALARGAGIGRNDPCPCGSGKRYKACHGALATGAGTEPLTAEALVTRGIEAHRRGDLDAAARDYDAVLGIAPQHPHALHYLGVIEFQRGRPEVALPVLERAAAMEPDEPEFHNNLGLALAALDRAGDAADAYRRALALKPDHAGAWNNLGLALQARNELAGAIDAFRQALAIAPEFTEARWNLALALLADGRFDEGWRAYEARLDVPAFAPAAVPTTPRWSGGDPEGLKLLLTAEQGLGDAIQFVRLASLIARRGTSVIVQTPRPLTRLFRSVEGVTEVVAAGDPLPEHDAWLPLLSLAGALHVDPARLPPQVPYLAADDALRAAVAATLATLGPGLRIGIAWSGNPRNTNDRRRSAPLAALAQLFEVGRTLWVSLQKGDGEDQLARVPAASHVHALPYRNDFDGTAALVAEIDLVISVDTSIVHLAGALGRPVFVLLPYASDWRWRVARSDSDWYPTARLFRQPAPGDWAGAVAAMQRAVAALAVSRSR